MLLRDESLTISSLQPTNMKLICLNIWGGKAFGPLMEYIKKESKDTDIFCFQEIFGSGSDRKESNGTRVDILTDIKAVLPGFDLLLAPIGSNYDNKGPVDFDVVESNAIFVRKNTIAKIDSSGTVFVRGAFKKLAMGETLQDIPSNFQYIRFSVAEKKFTLCNIHGMAYPGHKLDTPERLTQSKILKEFLAKEKDAKILCGDFNLMPGTESIKTLEEEMENLIGKFKIERTRSKVSPWFGKEGFQGFADYMFVSKNVNVLRFEVPDADVSDHLPLMLKFS